MAKRTSRRQCDLLTRLGIELRALTRTDDGWRATTTEGELEARQVVLATGAFNDPHIPDWPGRRDFSPPLTHSSAYRSPAPYANSTVLVVGSGNSGTEVAVDLASIGDITVELASHHRTSCSETRGGCRRSRWESRCGRCRPSSSTRWSPFSAPAHHSRPDLIRPARPPKPYSQFRRTGTIPVLGHGFVTAVQEGRIRIHAGVDRLDAADVEYDDGTRSQPDAVIAATGYRTGLGPILGPLGLLDERTMPTIGSHGGTGKADNLYVVGFRNPAVGLPPRNRPGHPTGHSCDQPRPDHKELITSFVLDL